jgi:hypothetical protein
MATKNENPHPIPPPEYREREQNGAATMKIYISRLHAGHTGNKLPG